MNNIKNTQLIKAFSLIELLVVVSIIGILSTLILANYNAIRERARDAERKSDIKQYQTALEVFANKNNGFYPAYSSEQNIAEEGFCADILGFASGSCPEDPLYVENEGPSYKYKSSGTLTGGSANAVHYYLTAVLESGDGGLWYACDNGVSGITSSTEGICF